MAAWQRQCGRESAEPGIPTAAPAGNAGQQGPTHNHSFEERGEIVNVMFTGIVWEFSWFCNTAQDVCLIAHGVEPSDTYAAWSPGQPLSDLP